MTINVLACLKSVSSHLRSSNQYDTKTNNYEKKYIYSQYKNNKSTIK